MTGLSERRITRRTFLGGAALAATPGPRIAPKAGAEELVWTEIAFRAEVVIYSRALSTTERESVDAYLEAKWGV